LSTGFLTRLAFFKSLGGNPQDETHRYVDTDDFHAGLTCLQHGYVTRMIMRVNTYGAEALLRRRNTIEMSLNWHEFAHYTSILYDVWGNVLDTSAYMLNIICGEAIASSPQSIQSHSSQPNSRLSMRLCSKQKNCFSTNILTWKNWTFWGHVANDNLQVLELPGRWDALVTYRSASTGDETGISSPGKTPSPPKPCGSIVSIDLPACHLEPEQRNLQFSFHWFPLKIRKTTCKKKNFRWLVFVYI